MKLFTLKEAKWTSKIQGRTNTRQNCSRVDAALKEDFEFFVFYKACGPLAQAIRRSQSKEHKSFTKPKIGLRINQSTAWRGPGRPGAALLSGMSSTTSTSSSSTWTEEHHQEHQEDDPDQENEVWWASYSGSEAAKIAEYFATDSSTTTSSVDRDEPGPATSPISWWDYALNEFQQAIDFYKAQQQGHQEIDMWDSSSEGSRRQMTTSRRKDRCRLTAKELENFDKEMKEFFKNYKSPIGSESG